MISIDKKQIDEEGKIFWDSSYNVPNVSSLWSEPPVPFIQNELISILQERNVQSVIDFPCGDGRNLIPIASNFKKTYGADSSENALKLAEKRLRNQNIKNCSLYKDDLFDSSWETNKFDGIVCWDVLGVISRPLLAINELIRIMKPGGVLVASIFSTGDSTKGLSMEEIEKNTYLYKKNFYFKFYNKNEAVDLAKKSNGKLIDIKLIDWIDPPHKQYRDYEHRHESHVLIFTK